MGMIKKTFNDTGDKTTQQGATVSRIDRNINIWTILCCAGLMDMLRYLSASLTLINPQSFFPPNVSWGKEVEQDNICL